MCIRDSVSPGRGGLGSRIGIGCVCRLRLRAGPLVGCARVCLSAHSPLPSLPSLARLDFCNARGRHGLARAWVRAEAGRQAGRHDRNEGNMHSLCRPAPTGVQRHRRSGQVRSLWTERLMYGTRTDKKRTEMSARTDRREERAVSYTHLTLPTICSV
eukprot:3592002-Rhodomonas_salina.1